MKAILLLTEKFAELEQIATKRPSVLMLLADKAVAGQIVVPLLEHQIEDITIVVTEPDRMAVMGWLVEAMPDYAIRVVGLDGSVAPIAALAELDETLFGDGELVLLSNRAVVLYDNWTQLRGHGAEAVVLGDAAVWVRDGKTAVSKLIDTAAESLGAAVRESEMVAVEKRPLKYLPLTSAVEFLQANQRLLASGFSSPEALERSYSEEFGVIPPVFIDKDAVIYSSMIGPYVSIGAGAVVENCVLRNAVIDTDSEVKELILEKTIVGTKVTLHGKPIRAIVADGQTRTAKKQ